MWLVVFFVIIMVGVFKLLFGMVGKIDEFIICKFLILCIWVCELIMVILFLFILYEYDGW